MCYHPSTTAHQVKKAEMEFGLRDPLTLSNLERKIPTELTTELKKAIFKTGLWILSPRLFQCVVPDRLESMLCDRFACIIVLIIHCAICIEIRLRYPK